MLHAKGLTRNLAYVKVIDFLVTYQGKNSVPCFLRSKLIICIVSIEILIFRMNRFYVRAHVWHMRGEIIYCVPEITQKVIYFNFFKIKKKLIPVRIQSRDNVLCSLTRHAKVENDKFKTKNIVSYDF